MFSGGLSEEEESERMKYFKQLDVLEGIERKMDKGKMFDLLVPLPDIENHMDAEVFKMGMRYKGNPFIKHYIRALDWMVSFILLSVIMAFFLPFFKEHATNIVITIIGLVFGVAVFLKLSQDVKKDLDEWEKRYNV
jgi:hypothetical protein